MKALYLCIIIAALGGSGYYVDKKYPQLKHKVLQYVSGGHIHTLEAKFTPQQIMETYERQLLKDENHKFLRSDVKFVPYLLMDVKYTSENNQYTGEGVILWDLYVGEMIVNTKNWDKTHGFSDCIKAGIGKSEFKILNLLAKRGGALDRDGISKALHVENDLLDAWIDNCRKKKIIVQNGNLYRLHLQDPKLNVVPETYIANRLVTKQRQNVKKLARKYSVRQIRRVAQAAFGQDFAIRSTRQIYLPVCSITIKNPDGTEHTSYWNALNGQELPFNCIIE